MTEQSIYSKALYTFGGNLQTVVCMEEMAELIKELSKTLRGSNNADHIAEEIADVQIMLTQMIELHGIEKSVEKWRTYKLDRLNKRIKKNGATDG